MCIGKVGGRMKEDKEGWDYFRIFDVFGRVDGKGSKMTREVERKK
jgi:hypothetical protein